MVLGIGGKEIVSRRLEKSKKRRREAAHETTMAIASSTPRRFKTAPLTAKEKRNKTPKPQSRSVSTTPNLAQSTKKRRDKSKQPKPLGPGTRPGAHQQLPIIIDSDDEDGFLELLETSASAAIWYEAVLELAKLQTDSASAYSMPTSPGNATTVQSDRSTSKVNPSHVPLPGSFPFSMRTQTELTNVHPERVYNQTESSTPKARPQPYHLGAPPSPSPSSADDGIELTLADIIDFGMRQKTADLMVMAPELPVTDLYRLLMDRQGRFEEAKQDVIRQSQRPSATTPTLKPPSSARAATSPITIANDVQDKDEDGPYIKFDFDDPSFIYDNDAPIEPFPEGRNRKNSQVRPKESGKNVTTKSVKSNPHVGKASGTASQRTQNSSHTASRLPGTPTKPHVEISTHPTTPTRAIKTRKDHIVKSSKGKGPGDINRSLRETSYDRHFVVPDEEILLDDSDTYSGSEGADVDMTDGTDLTIDMQPEYSYNSAILASPVSR